jgi:polyketide synthase 12
VGDTEARLRSHLADAVSYADLEELGAAVGAGLQAPDRVVVALASGTGEVAGAARDAVERIVRMLQAWLADDRFAASRLVLVTWRAVGSELQEDVEDLAYAPVWGLVRSAQAEHPDRFALVDLDGEERSLVSLPAALASDEPELAVRGGALRARRLARAASPGGLVAPWRAESAKAGTPDHLRLVERRDEAAPPAAGQLRIAQRAGGLNPARSC